jgi:periplasmic divalent cation tolerance protein
MDHSDAVLVLTTWPSSSSPTPAASTLVEERLAACVNVLPEMQSVYRWDDAVQLDRERQVVMKTTADRAEALMARLKELHPYEVPELLVIPVTGGGAAYLAWLSASTVPS